jgi:integrase
MAVYKRGEVWWYKFVLVGKVVRESAKTSRKTVAIEAERNRRLELEKTLAGMPAEKRENRIDSVNDVVRRYQLHYANNHRPQTVLFSKSRLAHISRVLGATLLPNLTEVSIREYITLRLSEGAGGRTINMEVGELSRAVGKHWSDLWPKLRKLEERKDAGKALSSEEEGRLLDAAASARSPILVTFLQLALLTGMRSGEITTLKWSQVDLFERVITVGRAKTSSGTGRQIPMNDELFDILAAHAEWFTKRFGETKPGLHLFPFGKPTPNDPTRPTTTMKTAWTALRERAGVECRLHDLRHTAATKMAEAGVSESTMLSLMGHMSRAMMERYSHIRMAAKRTAVECLTTRKKSPPLDGEGTKMGTVVESQLTH